MGGYRATGDDDCPQLFCPLEGRGSEGGRGRRSKEGGPNRNSNGRRGRSHGSLSVRSVGCEVQEKT